MKKPKEESGKMTAIIKILKTMGLILGGFLYLIFRILVEAGKGK
jgi:hypothetical protein